MTTVRPESRPHECPQFSSLHINKGTESPQIDIPNPSTGEYQEYTSIQDLWESVRRLQHELEMARPKEPLSGELSRSYTHCPSLLRQERSMIVFSEKHTRRLQRIVSREWPLQLKLESWNVNNKDS